MHSLLIHCSTASISLCVAATESTKSLFDFTENALSLDQYSSYTFRLSIAYSINENDFHSARIFPITFHRRWVKYPHRWQPQCHRWLFDWNFSRINLPRDIGFFIWISTIDSTSDSIFPLRLSIINYFLYYCFKYWFKILKRHF